MIKTSKIKGKAISSCLAIIRIKMILKILILLLIINKIVIVIQWTLFIKATFVPKHFDFQLNLLLYRIHIRII